MPGRQRELVDLRRAAPRLAMARTAGAGAISSTSPTTIRTGQSMSASVTSALLDHEAALEHPVVRDELPHEVGQRGPGPGDPALAHQEPALALARQQRLAVV